MMDAYRAGSLTTVLDVLTREESQYLCAFSIQLLCEFISQLGNHRINHVQEGFGLR